MVLQHAHEYYVPLHELRQRELGAAVREMHAVGNIWPEDLRTSEEVSQIAYVGNHRISAWDELVPVGNPWSE